MCDLKYCGLHIAILFRQIHNTYLSNFIWCKKIKLMCMHTKYVTHGAENWRVCNVLHILFVVVKYIHSITIALS